MEYDPSWDYDLDENPDTQVVELVKVFVDRHAKVLAALELSTPVIHFVSGVGKGHVARYVNGSASEEPIIVVDAEALLRAALEYDVAVGNAVETTLLHEYGHAYLDSTGRHEEMSPAREERVVEKFAYTYWKTGNLKEALAVLFKA